jgi:hypothetical protein
MARRVGCWSSAGSDAHPGFMKPPTRRLSLRELGSACSGRLARVGSREGCGHIPTLPSAGLVATGAHRVLVQRESPWELGRWRCVYAKPHSCGGGTFPIPAASQNLVSARP